MIELKLDPISQFWGGKKEERKIEEKAHNQTFNPLLLIFFFPPTLLGSLIESMNQMIAPGCDMEHDLWECFWRLMFGHIAINKCKCSFDLIYLYIYIFFFFDSQLQLQLQLVALI